MAYKTTISKACVNREEAVTEMHNQLLAMGWLYVDGACDLYTIPSTDVNTTDNTFTVVGTTYSGSQPVHIRTTGTVPGGLAINTEYYVVNVSGNTFKLSTTYNGSAIDISSQGSGTHTISESYRIYKSNSEASNMPYQYIKLIYSTNPNRIYLQASYTYNSTTKLLVGSNTTTVYTDTNQTGFYIWIHGNKDIVHITTKVSSTYYRFWFGFMKPFMPLKTTLSSAASTGSNVVLSVADSTGFEVGYPYQIIGVSGEGRDTLTSTAVVSGTITVSSLPRNYGSGAIIGINPVPFGAADQSAINLVNGHGSVGLGNISYVGGAYGGVFFSNIGALDPDMRSNKYILQPFGATNSYDVSTVYYGIEGYIDTNMLLAPNTGMTIEDTFAVAILTSGTSSGSNSTTVMNDTSKSWITNAYAGKVVIITFGTGSGMIKKITSNDATSITLSDDWIFDTIPNGTSQYIICEEGYRYMANGTGSGSAQFFALREGI